MATIKTKLKQLRDADVRYISLVDRAATRIPFRVLKRDKESKMGIDLTQVFKSDGTGVKPFISSLVVFAQKDESAGTQVQEAIKQHGFITDRVQKSDEGETLVYAQQDQKGTVQVVRLSDQLLATVGGLTVPSGWVGELVEEHGFFPDLEMVTDELHARIAETVAKSETPIQDVEAALTSYAEYLTQVAVLPANCFQLNDALAEVVKKCACTPDKSEDTADEKKTEAEKAESPYTETKLHSDKVKNGTLKAGETEDERKKRIKDHPPSEMAPVDEEDDQKPPPEAVSKSDIFAVLKGMEERTTAQLTSLSTKLETVSAEQVAQKKALDDVAQKADTLGTQLSTTVMASPVSEDRPAPGARMRVQKDDDPRTGNFDTAFLRRRRI
jgi:hypothetical protein